MVAIPVTAEGVSYFVHDAGSRHIRWCAGVQVVNSVGAHGIAEALHAGRARAVATLAAERYIADELIAVVGVITADSVAMAEVDGGNSDQGVIAVDGEVTAVSGRAMNGA